MAAAREISDGSAAPLPYADRWVAAPPPVPFAALPRTCFRVAERAPAGGESLLIFPGFGVSVGQLGVDALLFHGSRRYARVLTHDAVSYPTRHDYVLWQYAQLLRELPAGDFRVLGLSLGGATALHFLFYLRAQHPGLYARCRKLVTLVSPAVAGDLQPRWQRFIHLFDALCAAPDQADLWSRLQRTALRGLASAIRPSLRRTEVEVDTAAGIAAVFAYTADTFRSTARDVYTGGLPELEVVSIGLFEDGMVRESRLCRYGGATSRHVLMPGQHSPTFYQQARADYDRLLLSELG